MTDDMAIATLVRIKTAIMALDGAIGEAMQPIEHRDPILAEHLLEALRHARDAEKICRSAIGEMGEIAS